MARKTNNQPKASEKPALPLNREKRENLIKWWRSMGWSYEQITGRFESGVSEAEYEAYKREWEA